MPSLLLIFLNIYSQNCENQSDTAQIKLLQKSQVFLCACSYASAKLSFFEFVGRSQEEIILTLSPQIRLLMLSVQDSIKRSVAAIGLSKRPDVPDLFSALTVVT